MEEKGRRIYNDLKSGQPPPTTVAQGNKEACPCTKKKKKCKKCAGSTKP